MTDAELANGLNIPVELVPKIDATKRAAYERMLDWAHRWNLYAAGLGERPADGIACPERRSP